MANPSTWALGVAAAAIGVSLSYTQWLAPKVDAEANFQMARLGFGAAGLVRMQVLDLVGQKTEIRFEGWKRNPAFAPGTFKFVPGKDVDVVGQ